MLLVPDAGLAMDHSDEITQLHCKHLNIRVKNPKLFTAIVQFNYNIHVIAKCDCEVGMIALVNASIGPFRGKEGLILFEERAVCN